MILRLPLLAALLAIVLVAAPSPPPSAPGDRAAAAPPPTAVPLAAPDEPGVPLDFSGLVLDMNGHPLPRVAVVAYQADATGHYAPPGSNARLPRLRAVAVTDDLGRYRFRTIRPGAYPGRADPAHIHLTIAAPVHHVEYVTFFFEGDPRLPAARQRGLDRETVVVTLAERADGALGFRHDVRLRGN